MQELQELSTQSLLSVDHRILARQLIPILRANPEYSWISFSRTDGMFIGVTRGADGGTLINFSYIDPSGPQPRTILDEFSVGENTDDWKVVRHSDDHGYDPRKRDFYTAAMDAKKAVWTKPYVFYDGVPGLTYAAPRRNGVGKVLGVLTVDFNLNGLSEIMRQVQFANSGEMFMMTPDGVLLAHPRLNVVSNSEQRGQGKLKTIADVSDPVLTAFGAATQAWLKDHKLAAGQSVSLSFNVGGTPYLGAFSAIHLDEGLEPLVGVASPRSEFLGQTDATLRYSVLISVLALAVAVILAIIFATTVAKPLTRMAHEMDRVGQFYLDAGADRASVFSEIDTMEKSLRHMKAGLRAFAAYVPRDLVRSLLASGQEACLEGETRTLTVCFSDIANFTALAETLTPHELVQKLGRYFETVGSIMAEHHGTLDKFMGDGIMAFWGAPEKLTEPAADAVRAALAIQQKLLTLRGDAAKVGDTASGYALRTRIGLATGPVLVGNVGTPERLNYTVMGDAANLASRLEGLNKIYGTLILIDEPTRQAVGDAIVCRPIDVVAVKGKIKDCKIYEPLCLASDPKAEAARQLSALSADALNAYLSGDMNLAKEKFTAIVKSNLNDRPASVMRDKCDQFLKSGVPENWTGITRFKTK
jgi:adenylate cyclase